MAPQAGEAITLYVDVGGLHADAAALDALARLALIARRHTCQVSLFGLSRELEDLIELAGLSDVLPGLADQLPGDSLTPRSTEPRC